MFTVLTLNNIALKGLAEFDPKHFQVGDDIENPDAILLRSHNLHEYTIPESVRVIGRAGAGTNNIPIQDMTERGIPVLNTPGANANAVKELVITGMLLASRNICSAWHYVQNLEGDDASISAQVEQHKKHFSGFELPGRTLAVIGLGNIGVKVANAAHNLGMNVIGYDPAITVRSAWELDAAVIQADSLGDAISHADFISLHVPLNKHTQNLLDNARFAEMQDGVIVLNFSRDGIIDNKALATALEQNKVGHYVCDFPNNAFKKNPRVIALPHLGASTKEAEENCAVMVAQQIQHYLLNGRIENSVNFPNIKLPYKKGTRLGIVNANVPNMVAQISSTLSNENINIIDMINKSRGEIAYTLLDIETNPTQNLLDELKKIDGVIRARFF